MFWRQALSNAIALVDAIALGEIWRRPARNINPISASHVAMLGAVVNVLLSLLKLVVGSLCGSAGERPPCDPTTKTIEGPRKTIHS